MKNKLAIILTLIFVLVLSSVICYYVLNKRQQGVLTIQNHSGDSLKEVELIYKQYSVDDKIVELGTLNNKETYKHNMDDSAESSIELSFIDKEGKLRSGVIVGYVYKGINSTQVRIIKRDNQYIFEIKSY